MKKKFCELYKNPERTLFWLDGKNKELGNSEKSDETGFIGENQLIVHENKIWISHELLQAWLPLEAAWGKNMYYLSLMPSYPLLQDLKSMREKRKENDLRLQEQQKLIQSSDPTMPKKEINSDLKYQVKVAGNNKGKKSEDLQVDSKTDIWGGTFDFGGRIEHSNESKKITSETPYWTFRQTDKKHFQLMEIGDSYFEGPTGLLPAKFSRNSFRIDKRNRVQGAGKTDIRGFTEPNTEVELYRNGIYQHSVNSGSNGRYSFDNVSSSGRDVFSLKFYFPDGREDQKMVNIPDDSALMLPQFENDLRFFYGTLDYTNETGEQKKNQVAYTSFRYGILKSMSLGISGVNFSETNSSMGIADMDWSPFWSLNILGETLVTKNTHDRYGKAIFTFFDPHLFQAEYRLLDPTSPISLYPGNKAGESWRFVHNANYSRFQLENIYQSDPTQKEINHSLSIVLSSNWNIFVNGGTIWPKLTKSYDVLNFGTNIRPTMYSNLRLTRSSQNNINSTNIDFQLHAMNELSLDLGSSVIIPDDGTTTYSTNVTYWITKNLNIGIAGNTDDYAIQINWIDMLSTIKGKNNYDHFGTGTVKGKITAPSMNKLDDEAVPVSKAKINIDGKIAETDENGDYFVSGISTNRKVKVEVDPRSLDVTMTPVKEFEIIYPRASSIIEYNPALTTTAGMDGIIVSKMVIPAGTSLEIIRKSDAKTVKSVPIESDGFFIVEGLIPDTYTLFLDGVMGGPYSTEITLPPKQDWLRGYKWELH